MLDVFFTVDVEISCNGWHDLDARFADIFKQNVYGPTKTGDCGLPFQIGVLKDHGLKGVFFVEPLFAARFGEAPLAEIVGLINGGAQEVQLHLHTEWVDEAKRPLLAESRPKQQNLRNYSKQDQTILIAEGARLLRQAGGTKISAFRAGNFGFNGDTLDALAAVGIPIDSSYNASCYGLDSGVMTGSVLVEPIQVQGVWEYPVTVFDDGTRNLRHTQLTACSFNELEALLWQSLEDGRTSFVIVSHNFELLNQARNGRDTVVIERFRKLCAFLGNNRDSFSVRGFDGLNPPVARAQPRPLTSPIGRTGARMLEQAYRRRFG